MTIIDFIAILIFSQFIIIMGYYKFIDFNGYFHLSRNSTYRFKFYTNADSIVTNISAIASSYFKVYYTGGDFITIKTSKYPLYYYKDEDITIKAYKKGSPMFFKNYLVVID